MIDGPLRDWPLAFRPDRWVRVLAQTTSTQDVARQLSCTSQQRVFIAARQTKGRGSRGRTWNDPRGLGLAMTMALPRNAPTGPIDPTILPLACGLAVIDAIKRLLGPRSPRLGLKWPNDVMQVDASGRGVRKLGGVLIEAAQGCLFAGIGINVHQQPTDFDPSVRDEAVSLRQLGVRVSRPRLAGTINELLGPCMESGPEAIIERWKQHDALRGMRCSFEHDCRTFTGIVLGIEPTRCIRLRLDDGGERALPAASTVRVRPSAGG